MEHNFHPILKKQQQECCLVQYRSKLVPESSIRGCTWLFSYIFYTFRLPNYFRCNPLYAQGSDFFQPDLLVRHWDAGWCLKRKNKQGKQTKNTHTNRHRLLLAIYLTKKHCAFGLFGLTASSACFRNLTSSPVQRLWWMRPQNVGCHQIPVLQIIFQIILACTIFLSGLEAAQYSLHAQATRPFTQGFLHLKEAEFFMGCLVK